MSVSCSTVTGIQLSLSLNSVLLFLFPPFFPFPVILLHLSQFKLTGGKTLFIFAIWLQVISLKAALRSYFLSFIVCLTIFWLLLTFAAVFILYCWPKSWIHVTWFFFGFMPSKCCHLIDSVPVYDASKSKWVTNLLKHKYSSANCSAVLLFGAVFLLCCFCSLMVLVSFQLIMNNATEQLLSLIEQQLNMFIFTSQSCTRTSFVGVFLRVWIWAE